MKATFIMTLWMVYAKAATKPRRHPLEFSVVPNFSNVVLNILAILSKLQVYSQSKAE